MKELKGTTIKKKLIIIMHYYVKVKLLIVNHNYKEIQ